LLPSAEVDAMSASLGGNPICTRKSGTLRPLLAVIENKISKISYQT